MVLDAQTGQPKGILTEADIAHAIADGKDLNEIRIRELTTIRPTVKPATTVRDAAQIMTHGHFRHCRSPETLPWPESSTSPTSAGLIGPDIPRRPGADATPARMV